ncbi:serine protease [Pseudolysobacter antarcticus]|uniref:Serine protease n=1 Tax=Pseudolysobacter antarcticus TaxID=2511995 RepID=A0A411HL12_9GAMM|nr:serine protease [Pseudolysobacter antarcticus]QBB71090.1 serine protease [Pseudolysobacter antarcticus]
MITSNVLCRMLFIRAEQNGDPQYGTAFTIDIDGKRYLVTAKHLLGDPIQVDNLEYMHDERWLSLPVRLVGTTRGETDIAVLAADIPLSDSLPLEPTLKGIIYSQDVYFVGYPYKMFMKADALAGRPAPFVKKGILSSAVDITSGMFFVDALNNEGFSGGPVVFLPLEEPEPRQLRVGGVVSKFKVESEHVLDQQLERNGMSVTYNTGFMVAYDIAYAVRLIRANPVGFPISA